jgi:hypothetical protein
MSFKFSLIPLFCAFFIVLLCFNDAFANSNASSGSSAWCTPKAPPKIDIKTHTTDVEWVFNKSEKDLNAFPVDTKNPYGTQVMTDVGGLMKGGIQMQQTMRFGSFVHRGLGQSCHFYDSVRVEFLLSPTIFIASEFPPGTCKHNAIKGHEIKHVMEDRAIVKKYAAVVGRALKNEIDRQTIWGPVPIGQSQATQEKMRVRLENILKHYSQMMEGERRRRQQAIDSLAEYERVNNMCR